MDMIMNDANDAYDGQFSKDICPFEEAEKYLNSSLPASIKKIFIANGFSNNLIISKINDSDIESTELFPRDILPDLMDEDEYSEYYGIFKKNFKF